MRQLFRVLPYFWLAFGLIGIFFPLVQFFDLIDKGGSFQGLFSDSADPNATLYFVTTIIVFVFACVAIATAILMIKKKGRISSIVLSSCLCLLVPIGTVLGLLSVFVLTRSEIKQLYSTQ